MNESEATSVEKQESAKLAVCICLSHYWPIASGAERQAHRQACELVRRGHRVIVLTRTVPKMPRRERVDGVEVRRVIRTLNMGPAFGATFISSLAAALWRFRHEIDVIHCHQALWEAVSSGLVHSRMRVPSVVQPAAGGEFGEVAQLHQTKGRSHLRRLILNNSYFVAISEQIQQELRELGVEDWRLERIGSGVDVQTYCPGNSPVAAELPGPPRVLFLARLSPQKNLPMLLDAWEKVHAQKPEATLILAGEGPLRDALQNQTNSLRSGASIHFAGQIEDAANYLRAADVFVLPSFAEGMSNSLLEAMATGLPVIVSNIGGNTDLVDHERTGLTVDVRSSDQLAQAILRFLKDPELRQVCGKAAREYVVRHFSIESVVNQYVQIYQRLLNWKA